MHGHAAPERAIPGVSNQAENHDLLQPFIHMSRGNCENVDGVGIRFWAQSLGYLLVPAFAAFAQPTTHAFQDAAYIPIVPGPSPLH